MRYYLSSYRMGDRARDLVRMTGPGGRVAVVSNALDFIPMEARQTYARSVYDQLADFEDRGLTAEDLDLRDYFGRPEALGARLAGVDLVWATGGNAFLLRRAMRESGLDGILLRRLDEDSLVYGGYSAGACVAGPTLRGIEMMDAPEAVQATYGLDPDWTGMGLVDVAIVPHFESEHPEADLAARTAAHMAAVGQPHRTLRDGEVILRWDGA